jgi:Mg2+ and Co2+ transporter CorA
MSNSKTETLFDQAADTFVNAFKTCVHLQEDTAKQCLELVKGWSATDDWAKHSQQFMEQTMPGMKKASEQAMELWKANATKSLKLLGEGFATTQAQSPTEAQTRLQKLWEESLKTMQENTESVVKLSSEAMQAYADYMKDLTPEPAKP